MHTVLSSASKADVELDPFPHVVVRHALDEEWAERLMAEFPALETVVGDATYSSNERFDLSAAKALVHPADALVTHRRAGRIYFDCRRKGLTVRSTIDCLIAQLALEHDLSLLQDDQDYRAIREIRPLRLLP